MANVSKKGLRPIKSRTGGPILQRPVRVLTNNTTAIFLNDAVVAQATGDWIVTAATNTLMGSVSCGASYVDTLGKRIQSKYLPAATLYTSTAIWPDNASYINIVDQPADVDFECQVDEAIALTDLNLNYCLVLGAGSTVTGNSAHELDATGRAVTATFPVRVRDFIFRSDNDISLTNAKVSCTINAGQAEPDISAYTGT